MICYLVTEQRTYPMRFFLETWGKHLAERVRIVTYESLVGGHELPQGDGESYIFTNFGGIGRMGPRAQKQFGDLHNRLIESCGADKVHNDPARSLRRFDLLRHLHDRGVNSFNAYRVTERGAAPRFPALVRHESQSIFEQPALAHDSDQYKAQLRGIKWRCGTLREFIAVEFCDTADANGLYRKYGAFVVGKRIVPRHIFFSRDWHIRNPDLAEPEMVAEELAYLDDNPHADALLECARLAGISYGRIDYGVLDGRPQVWEINTNAALVNPPGGDLPQRAPVHERFVEKFTEALAALDGGA
jgi:hypothetical protein